MKFKEPLRYNIVDTVKRDHPESSDPQGAIDNHAPLPVVRTKSRRRPYLNVDKRF